jgi:hypothetical protein
MGVLPLHAYINTYKHTKVKNCSSVPRIFLGNV